MWLLDLILLILLFVDSYLMPLGEQCGNAIRAFQFDEGIRNTTKDQNSVDSLECGILHG